MDQFLWNRLRLHLVQVVVSRRPASTAGGGSVSTVRLMRESTRTGSSQLADARGEAKSNYSVSGSQQAGVRHA